MSDEPNDMPDVTGDHVNVADGIDIAALIRAVVNATKKTNETMPPEPLQ